MAASIQLQAGKVQSAGVGGKGLEILQMSDLGLKLSIVSHRGRCWWHHVPVLLLQPPPGAAGMLGGTSQSPPDGLAPFHSAQWRRSAMAQLPHQMLTQTSVCTTCSQME